MVSSKLSVVIPAFNEGGALAEVVKNLLATIPGCEVIVVDDSSTDSTFQIASRLPGITILQNPFNMGYGASVKAGMRAASGEYVAWFDADGQHSAADLLNMYKIVVDQRLCAVLGQRAAKGQSYFRLTGKFFALVVAFLLKFRAGHDLNCGLRVFRRELILNYLHLLPDGYSASLTSTMIMIERGYPTRFFPIKVAPRIGVSKVRIADGFRTIVQILRMVMLFAPLRIFLRSGLFFCGVGIVYGVSVALWAKAGLPVAAAMLFITGILLCMLGLVADQISQIRLGDLGARSNLRGKP